MSLELAHLTYPEVEALAARGAVVLWPIGSTEAHGPHLPLSTDVIIAEHTARRAAAQLTAHGTPAVVAPPLALTVTEFARPFAGTLSLPRETALAVVRDGALALAAQGFAAVVLVNGHLEPAHRFMLRDAVKAARALGPACPLGIADPADARWASSLTAEFQSGSCHAGQYETSLVLAARPELVRATAALPALEIDLVAHIKGGARDFAEAGAPQAYCGAPAAATVAEGEASYTRLAEVTTLVVRELLAARTTP